MHPSTEAFFDELEKIAVRAWMDPVTRGGEAVAHPGQRLMERWRMIHPEAAVEHWDPATGVVGEKAIARLSPEHADAIAQEQFRILSAAGGPSAEVPLRAYQIPVRGPKGVMVPQRLMMEPKPKAQVPPIKLTEAELMDAYERYLKGGWKDLSQWHSKAVGRDVGSFQLQPGRPRRTFIGDPAGTQLSTYLGRLERGHSDLLAAAEVHPKIRSQLAAGMPRIQEMLSQATRSALQRV